MKGNNNRGSAGQQVKVVIIDTKFVETDASSFKSVVQQLTGKNATAKSQAEFCAARSGLKVVAGAGAGTGSCAVLSRGLSFKHFDGLLMDLPLDELLAASIPVWNQM